MKKVKKGQMNVDFNEHYDQENDIYYVSFKTGEPSYVIEEIEDILLLEVGVYTSLPTGFRILNYSKHDVGHVNIMARQIKKQVNDVKKETPNNFDRRSQQIEKALKKVLV